MIKFEDYEHTIKDYAYVAWKKTKKPSVLEVEDFVQEGYVAFLWAKKRYKTDSKASFKTYLIMTLRCHFETIFKKSYKRIVCVTSTKEEENGTIDDVMEYNQPRTITPYEIARVSEILNILTPEEMKYITFSLCPPKVIVKKMTKSLKNKRRITRKALCFTRVEENNIRKSLKNKLMSV